MHPIALHVSLRLLDGRVIAPSVPARRALARCVIRVATARGLLAFRGSDTHVHLLLLGHVAEACETVRRVRIALHRTLDPGVPFATPHFEPVVHQDHLGNAFDYILRQDRRHGFASDPTHDASVLPDLLGMRRLCDAMTARVREWLPRLRRDDLLPHLGVTRLDEGGEPEALLEGAAAALALSDLAGRDPESILARAAFACCAQPTLGSAGTAAALGCTPRAVQKMLVRKPDPRLLRAVRLQAGLRAILPQDPRA